MNADMMAEGDEDLDAVMMDEGNEYLADFSFYPEQK